MLKEVLVLQELVRQDAAMLCQSMVGFHASGAQVLQVSRSHELRWSLFELCRDEARLVYHRLGQLLNPWDDSWQKRIDETKNRLSKKQAEIADTGQTPDGILKLIQEFEEFKAQEKPDNESG